MKNIIFIFLLLLFLGCKTNNHKADYNFIYHDFSYDNSILYEEILFDSKAQTYIFKERNKPNQEFKETKIQVYLNQEELKKIYELYLLVKISNPNSCIYDNNELLYRSTIRFYEKKNIFSNDENCNIDIENKQYNKLWGEITKAIQATNTYREAFKYDFIDK